MADTEKATPLGEMEIRALLASLDGWSVENGSIHKIYRFADHYETMAFVNAIAWVSHRTDHHPDLVIGYNKCVARYTTHDAGGLSQKDFACAARLDAMLNL